VDGGDISLDEAHIVSWLPAAGIDYDVISEEITLFFGSEATVKRGKLPKVRHTASTL
jgi:hypothetical protein